MEYQVVKLGKAKQHNVFLSNDIHVGSEALDEEFLDRYFKEVEKDYDNSSILINGDIFEMVTKSSKGDVFEQVLSPKEQVDRAVEIYRPYKELIKRVTSGNHDQRLENECSFDAVEMFCRYLGIEDKYAGTEGITGFSFNKKIYNVHQFHGVGGGSTLAAVENNLKRYRSKSHAHVTYCGHFHKQYAKPIKHFAIDPFNKVVREEKHWLVCGNTCVQTAKYAKKFGYEESFPSQAVLRLAGRGEKQIDVDWIY
ncbi:metal-dependent hydrolase [Bacillus phage Stills]|uniref:Metal-dependent hydrolase n=1 Tax=Bacillus phage Stills TaxID=1610833 RepID=A0A0E3T5J5_9CAUD|nr:DNA repair exonuclease [Bacillus phage Stills]AKC02656.1 metal-dependent hydrolase [Bacillus phage Stills]